MAKVLRVEDKSHPGCMSNIFHVKKILPHRKCKRRYKRISDDQDYFEVLKLFDTKTSHILVDGKTFVTRKRSLKARIKALIYEDNVNDKVQDQDQDFVSSPKLQRTYSIHHLGTNEWVRPIIFFPENVTESAASSKTHVNLTNVEINDSRGVLEMFKVDKELFINSLQDRSVSSDAEPKLTKSGSFPTAYKSFSRNLMPMKLEDKLNESYTISKVEKMKNPHDDVNAKNVIRLRRVYSLNESATRFLDLNVGKEATLRTSRSLKLTNGSQNLSRNDLNQGPHDTYFLRSFSRGERNPVSFSLHKSDTFLENEHSPNANSPAFCEDAPALQIEENNYQISKEITEESPVLVTKYDTPDEVQVSKGYQEIIEKEIKAVNNKKQMDSSKKDDDFTYVKKILERSGFIKNGFQQAWYSTNHPLDPFVFQEIESHYVHDPERFAEEVFELSHRLLIFDLVDEVLLTMYERLCTYYPKKLSSYCHISPVPTGSLVLDEVWNNVRRFLNFEHDINESLNDIVSRDLKSDDGWMNLQLDSECVGLDLEDLILDEVIEEMVFELI
ncbi:hypothetical protein M8C21_031365 [Ambrosia artemisiifolia]|uniref:DUF4378 domain-containing protein n=1 Tax=Ambrosia artemisiifolia TaxID=4212 RepID=A0AAD5G997_AMBAR|nr:hypothetical protein M8C21_031365 [Ambrosia artemisiifolia]